MSSSSNLNHIGLSIKPRDVMFNKGRSGSMNLKISIDSSPRVDHSGKSAGTTSEEILGDLNQIHISSSKDVERSTVRSRKAFFEAMVKADAKKSAPKIASDEKAQPLHHKGLRAVSKEGSTPPKFRVHLPRQQAAAASSDLILLPSVSVSPGQEQRAKVIEGVTTFQGLHPTHADRKAPLLLSDLNRFPSLGKAQGTPATSVAVDADSQAGVFPATKRHINTLSLDWTADPIFPPSPPLTPKTPNSQNVDIFLLSRLRPRVQLRTGSDSSPDTTPSPSQRSARKISAADKRKETRDNTIEFLATLQETPVKVESYSSHTYEPPPKATCSHAAAEVQELRDKLANAMRDLQAAKDETVIYKNSTVQINRDLERLAKDLNATTDAHKSLVLRHERTRSELEMARDDFRRLTGEKREWQEQFDVMHHKVVQAERQIRRLDHLTKARFEARQDDVFGSPTRTKKLAALSRDPSTEVVKAISSLNIKIQQLAKNFVGNYLEQAIFCPIYPQGSVVVKAKKMLGEDLTQMLQAHPKMETSSFYQLLVTVVLEIFLVRWCSSIIEGWYPERLSFSDLLAKLSSQVAEVSPLTSPTQCGKQMRVIETLNVASSEFLAWAADAFDDLSGILMIGGLSISSQSEILSMIRDLFDLAYGIRVGLAEKDICHLELVVVGPGTPFHPKWMDESHTLTRKGTLETLSKMGPIVGTTGLGLKLTAKAAKNDEQSYLLKPKVVLWNNKP